MAERPRPRRPRTPSTLDADVFGAPFNGPLVHEVVLAELAARRQGTHATKTRGMVRGGGAKPWRQKGTGRARAGSSRSPLWTGGGTVFGPSPRHYTVKVNRKARQAALRSRALACTPSAARSSRARRAGVRRAVAPSRPPSCSTDRRAARVLVVLGADEVAAAKSFRNLERVTVLPAECAPASPTSSAPRSSCVSRGRARQPRARAPPRRARGGRVMDATQIIIRPVVSEKSYVLATAGKYTFRVHPDAHKTQIRQAVEELFDVNVLDVRTIVGQSKPKRRGYTAGRTPRVEEGHRAGARGRHHPDLPGPGGRPLRCRSASPSRPRPAAASPPTPTSPRSRRRDAREVAHRGPQEVRRAQRQRAQDLAPPRRRRQARLPQDRLQAPQGRRAGQGRRDRVRPQPLRLHRAAALPRRREALHPRPEPPARRHDGGVRHRRRHHRRQRAAAGDHPGRHDRPQRRAAARPRRPDGPLRRRGDPADGQGGRHGHAAPALRRDAPGARASAARPSARSATPTTRTSRSARPAASATWACARRRAARP